MPGEMTISGLSTRLIEKRPASACSQTMPFSSSKRVLPVQPLKDPAIRLRIGSRSGWSAKKPRRSSLSAGTEAVDEALLAALA